MVACKPTQQAELKFLIHIDFRALTRTSTHTNTYNLKHKIKKMFHQVFLCKLLNRLQLTVPQLIFPNISYFSRIDFSFVSFYRKCQIYHSYEQKLPVFIANVCCTNICEIAANTRARVYMYLKNPVSKQTRENRTKLF